MNNIDIQNISNNISNCIYRGNIVATEQLVELFDRIARNPLLSWKDYVKMYDDNFYTYRTWKELVESELEQSDGLTEEECVEQINQTIWHLPCGWYVQYV